MSQPAGPGRREALRHLGRSAAAAAGWALASVGAASSARAWSLPGALTLGAPKALAPVPLKPVVWSDFLGLNAQLQWFAPDVAQQQVVRVLKRIDNPEPPALGQLDTVVIARHPCRILCDTPFCF